jgi:hypothetical protein
VDTWQPSWYIDPDGAAARWLEERATDAGPQGSRMLPKWTAGELLEHRLGWFKSGLVFAAGHPQADGLCAGDSLHWRFGDLEHAIASMGLELRSDRARPLRSRSDRPSLYSASMGEGFGGLSRVDATINLETSRRAVGLATLAGIAAAVRDAPGKADIFYGAHRGVETVSLRGHAGRRIVGRWYDKGLESGTAFRGLVIRGEDQRRWSKPDRRDPRDLSGLALRDSFRRRFYPLWQATKGVTVVGPVVIAEKLLALQEAGEIKRGEMERLMGHVLLTVVGGRQPGGLGRSAMYRREKRMRQFGLSLADGVLEEVEVDVGEVLEQALESDAWQRTG